MNGDTMMTTTPVSSAPHAPGGLRMTPGRWVALAIGVPIALVLIVWTGFSLVSTLGQASFPVSATIPLQDGRLVASTGGGDVTLHQDQVRSSEARLTGTVQYSLIRPRLTVNSSGVGLHCRIPTGNCGLSATLDVPADTAVNLTTGGGNVQASGIDSDLVLNTGGGDVTVSGIGGTANVTTGGGNLTASDLGGTVQFSTDGGDVGGNSLTASQVTMGTGGGNVTLVFTRAPVNLNITSAGGDVSVLLPHGSTRYAISSIPDGGDYSASVPTNAASPNKITVDSGGGNISVAEAS
jgi:hypothetical protein